MCIFWSRAGRLKILISLFFVSLVHRIFCLYRENPVSIIRIIIKESCSKLCSGSFHSLLPSLKLQSLRALQKQTNKKQQHIGYSGKKQIKYIWNGQLTNYLMLNMHISNFVLENTCQNNKTSKKHIFKWLTVIGLCDVLSFGQTFSRVISAFLLSFSPTGGLLGYESGYTSISRRLKNTVKMNNMEFRTLHKSHHNSCVSSYIKS